MNLKESDQFDPHKILSSYVGYVGEYDSVRFAKKLNQFYTNTENNLYEEIMK